MLKTLLILLASVLVLAGGPVGLAQAGEDPAAGAEPGWERYFTAAGVTGAFVGYDLRQDRYVYYARERCGVRFLPASTFKIVNALIGLETGIIPDEDYQLTWNGVPSGIADWDRDHTLASAFKYSVVWYYQELARRVGEPLMQYYLDRVDYGNRSIEGGIDRFWLTGGLRISPEEQVALLVRLYRNQLPFSPRTMAIVRQMMIVRQEPGFTLRAKTGWARTEGQDVGWYVGYVEHGDDVFFFATNIVSAAGNPIFAKARSEITGSILKDLGILK
jgi:beta-lactamase class D